MSNTVNEYRTDRTNIASAVSRLEQLRDSNAEFYFKISLCAGVKVHGAGWEQSGRSNPLQGISKYLPHRSAILV